MVNKGNFSVLGVNISAVDVEYAVDKITRCAARDIPLSVSALAVHGVMAGFYDSLHRRRLNGIDLVAPDGQPVRWALRWIHGVSLGDRIRGSELTFKVIEAAADKNLPIYLYGSTESCLKLFAQRLKISFPKLNIAGIEPSRFRKISELEKKEVIKRINESGARIVFVGLGCPRQEVWVYEYQQCLNMPLIAVGAAFSFLSGILPQAPKWMQRVGLEWFYRLMQEPRRLWRRYIILNPVYLGNVLLEALRLKKTEVLLPKGSEPEESYG